VKALDIVVRCALHTAAAAAGCPRCAAALEMNQANELMHRPDTLTVKKEWAHDPADARRDP
jgi:hypothetical protein